MDDMKNRALPVLASTGLVVALLILSKKLVFAILFAVFLAAVASVALCEFYKMGEKKGAKPLYTLGVFGTLAYIASIFLSIHFCQFNGISVVVLGVLLFLFFFQNLFDVEEPLKSISISFFGIVYIVVSLSFILRINFFYPLDAPISGQWWLMYLIVVTKAMDIGGYFVGKSIGKTPLAKKISPNKTVEGLIGGIVFSVGASILLVFLTPHVFVELRSPWVFSVIVGLILAVVGHLSDLCESLIKRDAKVKDSSRLKGTGGILDMVDSMLFTSPIFYLLLKYGSLA